MTNYTSDDITQYVQNVIGEIFAQLADNMALIMIIAIVGLVFAYMGKLPFLGGVFRRR